MFKDKTVWFVILLFSLLISFVGIFYSLGVLKKKMNFMNKQYDNLKYVEKKFLAMNNNYIYTDSKLGVYDERDSSRINNLKYRVAFQYYIKKNMFEGDQLNEETKAKINLLINQYNRNNNYILALEHFIREPNHEINRIDPRPFRLLESDSDLKLKEVLYSFLQSRLRYKKDAKLNYFDDYLAVSNNENFLLRIILLI